METTKPRWRRISLFIGIALTLSFSVFFGLKALTFYIGPLILDEWVCGGDKVPVLIDEGGQYCSAPEAKLRKNEHFDPLGNRPFDCSNRYGWHQLTKGINTECLRDGESIPDEYSGWVIMPRQGWWHF